MTKVAPTLVLATALLLAACSRPQRMEKPADAFNWGFHTDAAGHGYLAFAVDETDNQPIDLTCTPASGVVQVSLYLRDFHPPIAGAGTWPQQVVLASGETAKLYKGDVSYDGEINDAYYAQIHAKAGDPVLARFRREGRLASPAGAVTDYQAQTEAERQAIEAFFRTCESK